MGGGEAVVVVQRMPTSPTTPAVHVPRPSHVPMLRLSKVKGCSSQTLPRPLSSVEETEIGADDAALCFEAGSNRPVARDAPLVDNRCYVYRAMHKQELARVQVLMQRLSEQDAAEVSRIWDALLVARRDCEAIALRGVRVARDVSRDWQETVSDLIDRVVAQDGEICNLKQQLKQGGGQPAPAAVEELHAQVVRLKRQRDKLTREKQELGLALNDTQDLLTAAQAEAQRAQEQLASMRSKARLLRKQQVALLCHHMDIAADAEALESEVARLHAAAAGGGSGATSSHVAAAEAAAAASVQATSKSRLSSPRAVARSPRGVGGAGGASAAAALASGFSRLAAQARESSSGAAHAARASTQSPAPQPQEAAVSATSAAGTTVRSNSTEADSRAEDQFDQQLTSGPAVALAPAPVKPPAALVKQHGMRAGDWGAGAFDYGADLEACRQQLDLLRGLAL